MNVDLDPVRAHVETLRWVKKRQAELKDLESKTRDAIEQALGDNEIGQLDGDTVITWVMHKKRLFQQAKLKDAHPELVEEFTETVEGRQFKVL